MSYINKQGAALVRVKLTDVGRHLLALGQLTFSKYVIGDSEVDYDYVKGWYPILPQVASNGEFLFEEANGNVIHNIFSKVLRPKDKQPFLSTFLINQSNEHIFPLNLQSNIQLITGTVSNEAADRGFFSGSTVAEGLTAVTTTEFIKESGTVDLVRFDGGIDVSGYTQGVITLDTPLSATSANDYIMFKLSNCTLGNAAFIRQDGVVDVRLGGRHGGAEAAPGGGLGGPRRPDTRGRRFGAAQRPQRARAGAGAHVVQGQAEAREEEATENQGHEKGQNEQRSSRSSRSSRPS